MRATPASVSSTLRPYSSVSKSAPGVSLPTSAAIRRAGESPGSAHAARTSGARASSISSESASSTSAMRNGRCTTASGSVARRSRRWSNPASLAVT